MCRLHILTHIGAMDTMLADITHMDTVLADITHMYIPDGLYVAGLISFTTYHRLGPSVVYGITLNGHFHRHVYPATYVFHNLQIPRGRKRDSKAKHMKHIREHCHTDTCDTCWEEIGYTCCYKWLEQYITM